MATIHTLHILNKRPSHPAFSTCLSSIGDRDALLLIESGVLALADRDSALRGTVYALESDLHARAIAITEGDATSVNFDRMVALTAEADRVISW